MMTTSLTSIYDSARLAAGYAYSRPPVHHEIVKRIGAQLRLSGRANRALDVGCGAGLSTAALESLAEIVVGIEPERRMLEYRKTVSATAEFLAGQAERLPFASRSFELITAAGSVNYADIDLFFPEAERVLTPEGALVIYDFSAGRRFLDDARLEDWFARFENRYPAQPGYDLDVKGLAYNRYGLQLDTYEEIVVAVPMTIGSYLSYILSETSVERAILSGVPETEIRDWCCGTLLNVFGDASHEILFDAYIAYITRDRRH
jgi:ubiquinone/menaquinone biosynthesis C-methylase UbiE